MLTILFLCHSVRGIFGKTQFCEVETGQTNIILDIEESRGSCKYTNLILRNILIKKFTENIIFILNKNKNF